MPKVAKASNEIADAVAEIPESVSKKPGSDPNFKFAIKKNLTLPLIKPPVDEPIYIKFLEPVKIGKQIGDKDAAITTVVVDLVTGETMQYLVPAVFQGILHDDYGAPRYGVVKKGDPVTVLHDPIEGLAPDSYVGKCFLVIKHKKASGKEYHPHTVQEIEVE